VTLPRYSARRKQGRLHIGACPSVAGRSGRKRRRRSRLVEIERPANNLGTEAARRLTDPDWIDDAQTDDGGVRAAISNVLVGLKKEFYGKGPDRVKTYLNDEYVFTVLEGGLTRNEQTMVEAGE
jgi:Na+-translocating membrane potential-generating system (MpsC)